MQAPLEATWAVVSQREEPVEASFAVRLDWRGQDKERTAGSSSSGGRGTCSRCVALVSRLAVLERKLAELGTELRQAQGYTKELQQADFAQQQGSLPPRAPPLAALSADLSGGWSVDACARRRC